MNPILQNALRTSLILFVFALVGTAMMAYTFRQTHPVIEESARAEKLALISQVLPRTLYDNDLMANYRQLPQDDLLGTRRPSGMWLATRNGTPVGVVLEAVAPEGYSGDIELIIGLTAEGVITGVRVTHHKETPGLGDYIELAKSDWILQLNGKRMEENDKPRWRVKKDGGDYDSRAGATITPRAIVKAVRQALEYFHQHRGELLKLTPLPAGEGGEAARVMKESALATQNPEEPYLA
jgi:Na+-translocating ferredoxin:NAD+ oxidoreductase subunit G